MNNNQFLLYFLYFLMVRFEKKYIFVDEYNFWPTRTGKVYIVEAHQARVNYKKQDGYLVSAVLGFGLSSYF